MRSSLSQTATSWARPASFWISWTCPSAIFPQPTTATRSGIDAQGRGSMPNLPPVKMKIAALTFTFPTRAEPRRGLDIWTLLDELARRADLVAYCSLPRYFPPVRRHRDFIHDAPWLESFAD